MLIKAGEIISESIKLYRENVKLFLTFVGIMFIPTAVMQVVATPTNLISDKMGGMILLAIVLILVAVIINIWISIAFVRVIANRYKGEKPKTLREEIVEAKKYFWSVLFASILTGLAVTGGTILLVIPGIIFAVWFSFSMYTVIFEGKKGVDSLKASKAIVSGRWWSVLWRLFAPGFVFAILAMVVQWAASLIFFVTNPLGTAGLAIATVVVSAAAFLVLPLTTAAPTILYFNLKKTPVKSETPESVK
ncbi:MAG: hypothetical protein ABII02_04675 [Candidatus Magasanikbacteria bacterium]